MFERERKKGTGREGDTVYGERERECVFSGERRKEIAEVFLEAANPKEKNEYLLQ